MSIEHVRAAFERWHAAAAAGIDLLTAVHSVCSPDCIVHVQNGQDGGLALTEDQTRQARALCPDLSMEIDHITATDDRMLVQVSMRGTPSLIFQIFQRRRTLRSVGAMVARVNERAEFVELWPYINPGAMIAFPPRKRPAPPVPDELPGTDADASIVLEQWTRAATAQAFLSEILATTVPNCLVHGTNSEVGGTDVLKDQFAVLHSAFPELDITFKSGFVADDRLIVQFEFDGVQRGALGIAPASNSRVQSTGAIVARVTLDHRVQEMWVYLAPGMGLIFPRTDR